MQSNPNRDEFQEWLLHPVTRAFREYLDKQRRALMEKWASGDIAQKAKHEHILMDASAISACQTMQGLRDLSYDNLIEVLNDEQVEYFGPEAPRPRDLG